MKEKKEKKMTAYKERHEKETKKRMIGNWIEEREILKWIRDRKEGRKINMNSRK